MQSGGDVLYVEQQCGIGVLGFQRERFADHRRYVHGDGHECGGHRCCGLGYGDGKPASDLHPNALAFDHQPGRIFDFDRKLQSSGDLIHVEQQQRLGVFGFQRERFADHRRDIYRDGNKCGGYRCRGFGYGYGEPASDLHPDAFALHHQQGRVQHFDSELFACSNFLHVEQQCGIGVFGFQRERFPDHRRDLHGDGNECGRYRCCGLGLGDGEPASDLHPDTFTLHHQPGRIHHFDSELLSDSNLLHVEQQLGIIVLGFQRERLADYRRNLHGDRHQRGGYRRTGFSLCDREPASDLHPDALRKQHQPGFIRHLDGKLQSGGDNLQLDQHRVLRGRAERQRFPNLRHHLCR